RPGRRPTSRASWTFSRSTIGSSPAIHLQPGTASAWPISPVSSRSISSSRRNWPCRRTCATCVDGMPKSRRDRAQALDMRVTVIGCGDAFGSGGRFNTCFMLETVKATLLVDCGASTPVALNARGIEHRNIDGIVLSHLHGDHFGGLPFLLLDAQFLN